MTMDTDGNGNLQYIEGLGAVRLPGEFVPEFRESSDVEVADNIPQPRPNSPIPKHHRSPAMTMPSFVFINTNGDAGLNNPIPFGKANTVRVDNYTTQWCRVGGVHIAPNSYGWVIALDRAVTNAKLGWEAPPTVTQPAATTGAYVYTTWYEERFPHQSGISSVTSTTIAAPTTATESNVAGS